MIKFFLQIISELIIFFFNFLLFVNHYSLFFYIILMYNIYIIIFIKNHETLFSIFKKFYLLAKFRILFFKRKKNFYNLYNLENYKLNLIDFVWISYVTLFFFFFNIKFLTIKNINYSFNKVYIILNYKNWVSFIINFFFKKSKISISLFKFIYLFFAIWVDIILFLDYMDRVYQEYFNIKTTKFYFESFINRFVTKMYIWYSFYLFVKNNTILSNLYLFFMWIIKVIFNFIKKEIICLKNVFLNLYKFIKFIIDFLVLVLKLVCKLWKFNLVVFNVTLIYYLISIFYNNLNFIKQIFSWYFLIIIIFWIFLGFIDFLGKYKNGKFNSAIQKFWKRTAFIFWIIEIFLFLLFFYYYLNSSQEPLYIYDFYNLNNEISIQIWQTLSNSLLISIAIFCNYILILNTVNKTKIQNYILLFIITLVIFITLCTESYQFFYIINLFNEKINKLDNSINYWVLERIKCDIRVKQQYFILCLLAKYWHFIFIFISWFFFYYK